MIYVYVDQIDTPRTITRSSDNKIVWSWSQADPFGMIGPNSNPNGLGTFTYNPRFPGQLFDAETGLFYNENRYYSPELGRYITVDPLGLAGGDLSPYVYAHSQPTMFADPSGLTPEGRKNNICMAACGTAGALIGGAAGSAAGGILGGAAGAAGGTLVAPGPGTVGGRRGWCNSRS